MNESPKPSPKLEAYHILTQFIKKSLANHQMKADRGQEIFEYIKKTIIKVNTPEDKENLIQEIETKFPEFQELEKEKAKKKAEELEKSQLPEIESLLSEEKFDEAAILIDEITETDSPTP